MEQDVLFEIGQPVGICKLTNLPLIKISQVEQTMIFDENKKELVELFNAGLKNIRESGKYDEIIKKYLG